MELAKSMLNKSAYPEKPSKIQAKETHISWIFLTGKYAYKVKKPVNYGFLDFSTLEKRKYFCEQELKLNRRLCKDIYLSVVPIAKIKNTIKIGGTGKIIDYALKMKQLPQEKIMSKLLGEGKISEAHISKIAKIISDFHRKASRAKKYGDMKTIKFNWDENFQQTNEFIGKSMSRKQYDLIKGKIDNFIGYSKNLFAKRVKTKKIRDCHGDLHSGNIFIADKIYIFDAIEFNERFRYSDIASEIAFMAMDLDYHDKEDLSEHFVNEYIKYSKDEELLKLINFYKCYRAYVRGKVISFMRNEKSYKTAKKYFDLAEKYSRLIVAEPSLIVMCGLSGSGKSFLAKEIAKYGDFSIIRSDVVRKKLAKKKRTKAEYGKGIYTKEFTERTYTEMLRQARILLHKKSVILDATFNKKSHRKLAEMLAFVMHVPFLIVYCAAP